MMKCKIFVFALVSYLNIFIFLIQRTESSRKIFKGEDADDIIESWPYVGALYTVSLYDKPRKEYYKCTCTLIHVQWVLTSGHCLVSKKGNPAPSRVVLLRFGLTYRNNDAKTWKNLTVSQIRIHPTFLKEKKPNCDIAMLKLSTPVHEDNYIKVFKMKWPKLKQAIMKDYISEACYVIGFGQSTNANENPRLRIAKVDLYNSCSYYYSGTVCSKALGNKTEYGYGSPCSGDSGAPLICKAEYFVGVHFGSVPRGTCDDTTKNFTYIYTGQHIDFITSCIENKEFKSGTSKPKFVNAMYVTLICGLLLLVDYIMFGF